MKKIYNAPSVEVVKITAQNILAGSDPKANNTMGNGNQLSRDTRGPLDWEDED